MNDTTSITLDTSLFLKLRCSECKKCLSQFPIYLNNDNQNICGRCYDKHQQNQTQNIVYEALAEFVKFPCCYENEGCRESFLPKDIPSHEKVCDFKKIECITQKLSHCNWKGAKPLLLHHCQEKHPEIVLRNGDFEVDLTQSFKRENLIKHESDVFILKQIFFADTNVLGFCICNINENGKKIPYKLSFITEMIKHTTEGITSGLDKTEFVKILMESLKSNNSSKIAGRITFDDDKKNVQNNIKIDEAPLSKLKCRHCKQFALPPIYIQELKDLSDKNPICCFHCRDKYKIPVSELKITHLERVASELNYPCMFEDNGCSFIAKPSQMKQHIKFCPYGNHNCPLLEYVPCQWNGLGKNVKAHILETHGDMVLKSSVISENLADFNQIKQSAELASSNGRPQYTACTGTTSSCTFGAPYVGQTKSSSSLGEIKVNFASPLDQTFSSLGKTTKSGIFVVSAGQAQNSIFSNQPYGSHVSNQPSYGSNSLIRPSYGSNVSNQPSFGSNFSTHNCTSTATQHPTTPSQCGSTSTSNNSNPTNSKCYVMKFSDHLFLLSFIKMSQCYQWVVQIIGHSQDEFMFQLEIIDENNTNRSLISKQPCTSFTKKTEMFRIKQCVFNTTQLAPFLSKEMLTFKINIFQ